MTEDRWQSDWLPYPFPLNKKHAPRPHMKQVAAYVGEPEAAWALLVRDLITPNQFDLLYGPWRSVIGDPPERSEQ